MDLISQATNPQQYNSSSIDWEKESRDISDRQNFFWHYIQLYKNKWDGKSVLDIGTGSGWLLDFILKNGALKVTGIEPSVTNVQIGKKSFPNIPITQTSLEDFHSEELFGCIILNMSINHIKDLNAAFKKMNELLSKKGTLIITTPNYEYFKIEKPNQPLAIQEIDNDSYAVAAIRGSVGVLADIVRKTDLITKTAENHGFTPESAAKLNPTPELIKAYPKYENYRSYAIADLLVFTKE